MAKRPSNPSLKKKRQWPTVDVRGASKRMPGELTEYLREHDSAINLDGTDLGEVGGGEEQKRGRGQPPKELDKEQIRKLAMLYCTYEEIAAVMGCDRGTIQDNYADVVEKGRAMGNASLRRMQYAVAMKGNVPMLMWLGRMRLGQNETKQIQAPVDDPYARMTDEDLEREYQKIQLLPAPPPPVDAERSLAPVREVSEIDVANNSSESPRTGSQS